jgi:tricorn protease
MKAISCKVFVFLLFQLISIHSLLAIDPTNTRLLLEPAISKDQIGFIYASDLWIAQKDESKRGRF